MIFYNIVRIAICVFFFFLIVPSLSSQTVNGSDLTVKIAVFGVGNKFYAWWGHAALLIDEENTGRRTSYDFGVFSDDNDLLKNLIPGRLIYTSEVMSAQTNINYYKNLNCSVTVYTLDIPSEKKGEIKQLAEISVLPENCNYFYHFFNDNCSTRIRDIIDIATEGQFKERFVNETSGFTFRQQVRRHTWFSPVIDWLFDFFMGQDNDRKITVWQSMFLPSEVENSINSFFYTDENGVSRKLVSDTEIIYKTNDSYPVPDTPKNQSLQSFIISLVVSFILVLLFLVQIKFPVLGRAAAGITYSLLGLLFGAAGLLLFFLIFFTGYDYTFHNANLLFFNPLPLAAVPFGIRYARGLNYKRFSAENTLRFIWALVVLGVFISMLIKLLPMFLQKNFSCQIFALPIALTLSLGTSGFNKLLKLIFRRSLDKQ